jgi:hypothetical protein
MVMKIEKGKFYRSRNGRKWEVLKTDASCDICVIAYCDYDRMLIHLYGNGCYSNDKSESDFDLIAEWTEPIEIPWSDYPTWCKWVAMDKDGIWWGYIKKTKIDNMESDCWMGNSDAFWIPRDYTPRNFTGHWTESLFERPQK